MDLASGPAILRTNEGARAFRCVKRNRAAFEAHVTSVGEAPPNQILDDLLLPIDRDALARELNERYAVPDAIDAQVDAFVAQPFALEPFCNARLPQQVDTGVLQHAGAHPLFTIGARA